MERDAAKALLIIEGAINALPGLLESARRVEDLREALITADLKIRSFRGADESDVEFIRAVLKGT
jgi:hypothetical protein